MPSFHVNHVRAPQQGKSKSYWNTVTCCVAHPDGSAEIHHHYGRPELIGADGVLSGRMNPPRMLALPLRGASAARKAA